MKIKIFGQSYGYNGDLMYYRPIFFGLTKKYEIDVVVDSLFPVGNYKEICFTKIKYLKFFDLKRSKNGVSYDADFKIPSFFDLVKIFFSKFDLCLTIEFTPISIFGMIVGKIKRKRVITLIEGDPRYRGIRYGGFGEQIKKICSMLPDRYLVNNIEAADYLVNRLGVSKSRIDISPYLTSCPTFQADSSAPDQEKKENQPLRLLFLNSLVERKGGLRLVQEYLSMGSSYFAAVQLIIVGDGPEMAEIRKLVSENELQESIKIVGRISFNDVGKYYHDADAYILPTLSDYRSLGGFEAISFKKPVLLSKYDGAAHEIFGLFKCGLMFDPLLSVDFRKALLEVIELVKDDNCTCEVFKASTYYSIDSVLSNISESINRAV